MTPHAPSSGPANLRRLPIALGLIFTLTLTASAQQAVPGAATGWARVQGLSAGANIRVNTSKSRTRCTLKSDDADALICVRNAVDITFQRADIQTIKVSHRGRSALVGGIPGTVLMGGAAIALKTENCTGQFLCGLGAALLVGLGALLAVIGASIGALTDFTGPTISLKP